MQTQSITRLILQPLFVFAACLLVACCSRAQEAQFVIEENQRVFIALPSLSTSTDRFAASELSTYLKKIVKATVLQTDAKQLTAQDLVIVLGQRPENAYLQPEKLELEESIIDVQPRRVHIVGGLPKTVDLPNGTKRVQNRGTLYGVYNLLEELGVRWYRPEAWGEHVPQLQRIALKVGQRRDKPAYNFRMSFMGGYRHWVDATPEQNQAALVWGVRNRDNVSVSAGGFPEEMGGSRISQSRHIYDTLFPPGEYFANHPEYYALIDGKRRNNGQLCLGNPAVQRLTAEKVVQFAKENPQFETHSLEPLDHDLWCQCELCRAMDDPAQKSIWPSEAQIEWKRPMGDISISNRVSVFGKIVAEKVAKENVPIKLLWLAYTSHSEPPTKVTSLPENTLIMAAAFSSAFTDPQHSYSDYSRKLHDPQSAPNQNFVRMLKGYGKMTRMVTREYWSGIAWIGPLPLIGTMQDRLKAYREFPIDGVYNEVHPQWGPQGIDLYFYMRLMRNPDLDVEKELELYCRNYYGPAAEPMLRYHRLLEKIAQSDTPHYSYGIDAYRLFTPEVVAEMGQLMHEAKALVGDNQLYTKRFEGVWAGYEYTRLVMPYYAELEAGNLLEAAKHWERANAYVLSFKEGDVFDNGVMFKTLQFFSHYTLKIPAAIQKQAKEAVALERQN